MPPQALKFLILMTPTISSHGGVGSLGLGTGATRLAARERTKVWVGIHGHVVGISEPCGGSVSFVGTDPIDSDCSLNMVRRPEPVSPKPAKKGMA